MGGISKSWKNVNDPFHLVTNKGQPTTLNSYVQGWHNMTDPIGGQVGPALAKHNNTQDNIRGTMDPGQLFGPNATVAPGPNPNAPGSIMNFGGAGTGQRMPFNPSAGVPMNGVSTNGLQPSQGMPQQPIGAFNPQGGTPNFGMQNGQNNQAAGMQSGPNWSSIIAQALQGPTRQTAGQGMPVGPRFQQ